MATQPYFCILTAVGEAKDANAKALGTALKFTEMAVGDGNGALPTPDRNRTSLVRQVRRASINTLKPDPANPGQVIAEQIIPEDQGGWWIRELGLYDADGDLVAIGNCPETYKPQLAEGSGRVQVVRMVLIMSSAATVQLKIDPSVVLATRKYADDQDAQVRQAAVDQDAAHVAAADPHPQYLTEAEGAARIQAAVQALVNSSPSTLDTLAELAAALNNDKDFAVTMTNALALKAPKASPLLTGKVGVNTATPGAEMDVNGTVGCTSITARGQVTTHGQGSWLEWNRSSGDGVTYLMNQKGNGFGGIAFGAIDPANNFSEFGRWDGSGALLIGGQNNFNGKFYVDRPSGTESQFLAGFRGTSVSSSVDIYSAASTNIASVASATLRVHTVAATNRSINAGGTINASGNDYAEYMTKADACGIVAPGQIVGIDETGKLIDTWVGAVSFLIKSTAPSYVGGDTWGTKEALGMDQPIEPTFTPPEYNGAPYPGESPADDAGDDAQAAYAIALRTYQADQLAHAQAVATARAHFTAVIVPAYVAELQRFNDLLEQARQKVDRIAYCGQVPVNVKGAKPGQYVVPVQDGAGIAGQLVDADTITFDQYRRAVGTVQNVLADGRANVRVKPV